MSQNKTHEFYAVLSVRRRIHISGPARREDARAAIEDLMYRDVNLRMFTRVTDSGWPMETVLTTQPTLLLDEEQVLIERGAPCPRGPGIPCACLEKSPRFPQPCPYDADEVRATGNAGSAP